ncbi:ABC transporter ATP-binding protein [Aquisphaera insulae]|uniref:ABC transporter ATP-binding protein n=1 Tax=Aquisphaera insulae TaxID=2712864 RepID=UPI0013EA240A|nr:ABC transporter ATP-binding protein [Aquisphaera insulae]
MTRSHSPGTRALERLSLAIKPGERLVVLGPSGSGKTTLLRLIAGLDVPQEGTIRIGDRDASGVPPHQRDVAMVFQSQPLYPHLSVAANLEFSMKARGIRARERRERVRSTAELMGIGSLLERWPSELSGGERQRVALGRAVTRRPGILLLDEPFSSLDEPLRAGLLSQLLTLHRQIGSTLVLVTHDQSEALMVGERLAILDQGRLLQCDTPEAVYDRPVHRGVAALVGSPGMNLLPCQIFEDGSSRRIVLAGRDLIRPAERSRAMFPPPGDYELGFRPEAVRMIGDLEPGIADGRIQLEARVVGSRYRGATRLVELEREGHKLAVRIESADPCAVGRVVTLEVGIGEVSWFDRATGHRLS